MEHLNISQLDEVLCDVRKAFRLLYFYQRRVLDLVKFIGNNLEYDYKGGNSIFSNPCPRNGKGNLDMWAWDWLNMYYYEFFFGYKTIAGHNITFSIFIQSDTGYFDAENDSRISIENFAPVEYSKTRLILIAGQDGWKVEKFHLRLKELSSHNTNFSESLPDGGIIIGKAYNLSEFLNEESTRSKVEDFISFCREKNIIIKELVNSETNSNILIEKDNSIL